MQPTYFPWAGYLNLISEVDQFVFLDDAQYERGTWQNRNRVLVSGQPHWLTVPTLRTHLGQAILEVELDDKLSWRKKHMRLLQQVYGKHPFAGDMLAVARLIETPSVTSLSELNITLIQRLCADLGITTPLLRSSELGIPGKRTDRLIRICEHLGCDEYLSPRGSAEYLAEDGFVRRTDIRLSFHAYVPGPYDQGIAAPFVSHLSILDVLACLGKGGAAHYVRTGLAPDKDGRPDARAPGCLEEG